MDFSSLFEGVSLALARAGTAAIAASTPGVLRPRLAFAPVK